MLFCSRNEYSFRERGDRMEGMGTPILAPPISERLKKRTFAVCSGYSDLREAISIEKRYFTSDLSSLS